MPRELPKYKTWLMWLAAALFFLAEYFARVAPAVMSVDLMNTFHVRAFALGSLSAYFYYAYIIMQIPVGTVVDLLNTRTVLTIMACVCGLTNIVLSLTDYLFIANLARFIMGLSAAFAFVGALKIAYTWFPRKDVGMLAGATQALGMVGAAIGQGPVALMIAKIGWQSSLQFIGGVLIILSLCIYTLVQSPRLVPNERVSLTFFEYWRKTSSSMRIILCNRMLWLNGLLIGCLYAPTAAFAELWGTSYLQTVYKLSYNFSANALSCVFIGLAIGCPVAGYCSDKLKKRKPILFVSILLSALLLICILFFPTPYYFLTCCLLFFYGFFNSGIAVSYAYAADISLSSIKGTSAGFTNMAAVIIGALLQPVIGFLLDKLSNEPGSLNLITSYSIHTYQMAMLPLVGCLFISYMTCFFLKEPIYNKS